MASTTYKEDPRRSSMEAQDHMEDSDVEDIGPVDEKTKHEKREKQIKEIIRDYSSFTEVGKGLTSSARLTEDGRILVTLDLKKALPDLPKDYANPVREFAIDPALEKYFRRPPKQPTASQEGRVPKLNVVIMIVGSRGDVQPFLALGQELVRQGHRVRIATHEDFRSFVTENRLEFYSIGGDPKELMSYMVRNPGLMPGFESLTNGDIGRKRKMLAEIMSGCWGACTQSEPSNAQPFVADAIISNPPAFAHIHCAEALGIPLQMSFTMPWSPTTAFPHPLVNISRTNAEEGLANYLSYAIAELLTWQGLGDVINKFRTKSLGLDPLSVRSGPGIVDRLKVPWTYCFSPAVVPKPDDWQNQIDVVGFYFLDLAQGYQPPKELADFLAAGPPPIYIGFGSVVVQNAQKMTQDIFDATERAGVRALVSAGWGGLGGAKIPSHIFILGNVPHDWLFTRVFAVCHHGGAGTTAIGLRLGKPTIVVPFFGDQPFWGAMIHKAGAGPEPIKGKDLDANNLCQAIEFCKTDGAKREAEVLGEKIRAHDGAKDGVDSFYRHLPLLNMRCDLMPERLAVWWSTEHCLRLSAYAVQVLSDRKLLDIKKLELHRAKEYDSKARATDPVTGGAIEIFRTITHYYASIAQIFYSPVKGIINTTTAIPRGVVEIIGALQEGFQRLPEVYGSKVRRTGKINDFSDGVREGAKGLFWGYADAITGLVTEPLEGAKKEGFMGFIKGSGRSYINATMRPAAGIVGVIAHPLTGAMKSVRSLGGDARAAEQRIYKMRIQQGKDAVSASTVPLGEVERVMSAFKEACKPENEKHRRALMEERIQSMISGGGAGTITSNTSAKGKGEPEKVVHESGPSPAPQSESVQEPITLTTEQEEIFTRQLEEAKAASLAIAQAKAPNSSGAAAKLGTGEEEEFERQLRAAMEISLAEQRGYERGMLEAAARWRESGVPSESINVEKP